MILFIYFSLFYLRLETLLLKGHATSNYEKMKFDCEALDSTVSPSLSETNSSLREISEIEPMSSQQTPNRYKRKIPRNTGIKNKKWSNVREFDDVAENNTSTVVIEDDEDVNVNISVSKNRKYAFPKSVKNWFNAVSNSSDDKNVSLQELMDTSVSSTEVITVESDEESENFIEQHTEECPEEIPELLHPTVSKLDYFDLGDRRLFALEQNTSIYLFGLARIKVIRGYIEVLGYTLSNKDKSVDLYSPKGTSFLYITALETNDDANSELEINDEALRFIEQQPYDSCLFLCEKIENSQIGYIEKHIPQQIYPDKEENHVRYVFKKELGNWNVIHTSSEWYRICDTISPDCKVFLCGGKAVGKSTFLRFAINRLLMKYKKVRVVDLDPGQPEFTVPGSVSVHTITEPVFGPNFTHIKKPEKHVITNLHRNL